MVMVAHHIRVCMTDPTWKFAGLIGEIIAASAKTLQCLGRCRCQLYFTPTTPAEIFEVRRIIRNRRMELNN